VLGSAPPYTASNFLQSARVLLCSTSMLLRLQVWHQEKYTWLLLTATPLVWLYNDRTTTYCYPQTFPSCTATNKILFTVLLPTVLLPHCTAVLNQSINQNAKPAMPKGHSGPSSTRPLLMNRSHTTPCRPTIWIPLVQVNHLGHIKHCNTELKPDAAACTPRGLFKLEP